MGTKYFVGGKTLYKHLLEKYKDEKKVRAEHSRCLWLMREKQMTVEEALNYHRVPKNPNWKWIKKVNQRRRYGIDKKLLEMQDQILVELGHDKMTKYFYGSERLHSYCKRKGLNYKAITTIKKLYGGSIKNIVDDYRKGKYLSWYKRNCVKFTDISETEKVWFTRPIRKVEIKWC